ncbi:MAG: STAS domain-containing protein [Spirochaetes bacterium]|nr:STAS domain-containing protein [Spirochaetota bacterium]
MDYIRCETSGSELRLEFIKDDLVFNTTSFILEYIEKMINTSSAGRVILDLANVTHIDSSAVGMFISIKNAMLKNGKCLMLVGLDDNVRRILHFLDIANFLELDAA